MNPECLNRYLTTDEIAKRLRKKPETIQAYARQGLLCGFKVGRSWLFTEHDVETFVKSRR